MRTKSPHRCPKRDRATPLERFIRSRHLKARHVAAEADVSRAHLLRIREGKMEPTRPLMVRITKACACLTGEPLSVADLFDLAVPTHDRPLFVDCVTPEHAAAFAEAFTYHVSAGADVDRAFEESGVMAWPEDATLDNMAAAHRYQELRDQIVMRTFAALRETVKAAFFIAASEVLGRERKYCGSEVRT